MTNPTCWLNSFKNKPAIAASAVRPDFKALVLRLLDQQQDVEQVALQTLVPARTLYNWLEQWNQTKKKALVNQSSQQSARVLSLTDAQPMAFVAYLHTLPQAHFSRPQMAKLLLEQTGLRYASHYLPVVLRQMGLRCSKPRPRSIRRPPQATPALIERLRATFDGLQALGYNLDRVGFGFAHESSPQLNANTARLWSLGKADRLINTDKARANTFGFIALQGNDYC